MKDCAYLVPGSTRIGLTRYTDEIDATAAMRPDGTLVVIMMNRSDMAKNIYLRLEGEAAYIELPGSSIATAVIE